MNVAEYKWIIPNWYKANFFLIFLDNFADDRAPRVAWPARESHSFRPTDEIGRSVQSSPVFTNFLCRNPNGDHTAGIIISLEHGRVGPCSLTFLYVFFPSVFSYFFLFQREKERSFVRENEMDWADGREIRNKFTSLVTQRICAAFKTNGFEVEITRETWFYIWPIKGSCDLLLLWGDRSFPLA